MWIRLTSVQRLEIAGKLKTFHPGDWINPGRQTAQLWLLRGLADRPDYGGETFIPGQSGVLVLVEPGLDGNTEARRQTTVAALEPYKDQLGVVEGEAPSLPFAKTLIWDGNCPLRRELLPVGFSFLDIWEIAAPLLSYEKLAGALGTAEERERTQTIVRDLRVPVYDTRLIFARRCDTIARLFAEWTQERGAGEDDRLAFLRAFYRVKPLMLALPVTWIDVHAGPVE